MPKRGFLTAVLVGKSVDAAAAPSALKAILRQFLELPHIRKLVPPRTRLRLACTCCPNMVVGSARRPFGARVAVVGDMVTARLYKDGILSAHQTAFALAHAVLEAGIDEGSLERAYGPIVRAFRRDNRYARLVFLLHRVIFSSSVLSRLLYQAVITERKNTPAAQRTLENILWKIGSGDDRYEQIFRSMLRPGVLWPVVNGGVAITLRNYLTESLFGLHWADLGRFTTGVAFERLAAKALRLPTGYPSFTCPCLRSSNSNACTRFVFERRRPRSSRSWGALARFHGNFSIPAG